MQDQIVRYGEILEEKIVSANREIEKWKLQLANNPTYAMEHSQTMFWASAMLEVCTVELNQIRAWQTYNQTKPLEFQVSSVEFFSTIRKNLNRSVISNCRSPRQSTSAPANLINRDKLAVQADLLDILNAPEVYLK